MVWTVWGAFDKFRNDTIDLDSGQCDRARASRNYLFDQLKQLDANNKYFPRIFNSVPFGSFARKTKTQPLDDIDFLLLLDGGGTSAVPSSTSAYTYWLKILDPPGDLARFRDDYGYVSSIRVLNTIKSSLSGIANYREATIKRTQQAVVLKLKSYPWAFDIVPAIPIKKGWSEEIDHYLIPNGSGDWMRTDPRKDGAYITRVNQQHDGNLLPTLRLAKFWNGRTYNKSKLLPYYFETLTLKVFDHAGKINNFPSALLYFFQNCPACLLGSCPDPKGLGPNLDAGVEWSVKNKVQEAMRESARIADLAMRYERLDDHKAAIEQWGKVFGWQFPSHG